MRNKYYWPFVIIVGCFNFFDANAQEKEILYISPDTSIAFHWGAISLPLVNTSFTMPKGKFAERKPIPPTFITINEFLLSLRDRMFLYKDQQIFSDFKTISLAFSPSYKTVQKLVSRGTPAKEAQEQLHAKKYTLEIAAQEPKELTETVIQKITSIIAHDTRITILINNGQLMGHLVVKAAYAPYEPPVIVKHTNLVLFKFQLLEPLEGPTLLRIDTNENKRVFNMYKVDKKTKIIHIPNFQTPTRTAAEKEEGNLEKILKQASSYPPKKTLHLGEYIDYAPTALTLSLGTLVANPESRNYALDTFFEKKGKLVLQQEGRLLKIKHFRLSIFDASNNWQTHWIKVTKKDKWLTHLENLGTKTSIYFDKIVIEKNKQTYYLGQAFLFKIGKEFLTK